MKNLKYLSLILFIITACSRSEEDRSFNRVSDINKYQTTDFLPTLETPLDKKINGVYTATIPLAWQQVKNTLGELSHICNPQLQEINETKSHLDALKQGEFSTDVYAADIIIAKAFFKRSLPFTDKLERYQSALRFDTTDVSCFGFMGNNYQAAIAYYSTNNDFCIKLQPEDEEQEIILLKSDFEKEGSLGEIFRVLGQKIAWFNETQTEENTWRYTLSSEDIVKIPLLSFNIEKTYTNIMGAGFNSEKRQHTVNLMYQRTAFLLDETGAKVESEAKAMVDSIGEEIAQPQPKHLIFDKPFVVFLKRKDADYPYFALYITTAELMVLFKEE